MIEIKDVTGHGVGAHCRWAYNLSRDFFQASCGVDRFLGKKGKYSS